MDHKRAVGSYSCVPMKQPTEELRVLEYTRLCGLPASCGNVAGRVPVLGALSSKKRGLADNMHFPLSEYVFLRPNLRYDIRLSLVRATFVESMANVIGFTNSKTTKADGKANR